MNRRIQTQSIRDQVYDQMKEMVLSGTWPPGARIDLNKLIADFGVSKTPLNEAIQKLIQDGLLYVKPRSGTFVSALDIHQIRKTFEFRLALEIGAAQAIVDHVTPDLINKLTSIDAEMERAHKQKRKGQRKRFLSLDADFHAQIIAKSDNSLIVEHYHQVNSLTNVSRARSRFTQEEYMAAIIDHRTIIDALSKRDAAGFQIACKNHIENAVTKLEIALLREDTSDSVI